MESNTLENNNLENWDWRKLLRNIRRGKCVLLLGPEAASVPAVGQPASLSALLALRLAAELKGAQPRHDPADLAQVAQRYIVQPGKERTDLEMAVEDFYRPYKDASTPLHRNLAALPFRLCVTTTPDDFLANAFRAAQKTPQQAFYHFRSGHVPHLKPPNEANPLIYKLYGDCAADNSDSLVLTETDLLDFLQSRHGEIEPFQLQVLCSHVEQRVAARQAAGATALLVDLQGYLGGRVGMEKVLQGFYRLALGLLPGVGLRRKARRLCEEGLLSPEGHRESLGRGQIRRKYGLGESQLAPLVDAKVLRREDRLDSFSYELSHDSLAKAVHASRLARRKAWQFSELAIIVLAAGLMGWQWRSAQNIINLLGYLSPNHSDLALLAQTNLAEYAAKVKQLVDYGVIKPRDMANIPAGSFMMGSNDGRPDEKPVHKVAVKAFNGPL